MHSSTIAFNSAKGGSGGGVYQAAGIMRTDGCIVAKNTHGATPVSDDYKGNPYDVTAPATRRTLPPP